MITGVSVEIGYPPNISILHVTAGTMVLMVDGCWSPGAQVWRKTSFQKANIKICLRFKRMVWTSQITYFKLHVRTAFFATN